jgi:hypothetical protein
MRTLYAQEYLDSNCTIPFDEETFVDNTAWTRGTSFGITAVCFAAFVKLYFFPHNSPSSSSTIYCRTKPSEYLVPVYFLLTGISHGIAGIGHSIIETTTDPRKSTLEMASQFVGSAASILVLILGLTIWGTTPKSKSNLTRVMWWIVVLSFSAETICAVLFNHQVLAGIDLHSVVSFGILLPLLVLYIRQIFKDKAKVWHYLIKAGAVMTVVTALCYSYMFYPKCGSLQAYKECFQECPLPGSLNQNGFFNIALIFGMSGWAWSEDSVPSIKQPKILLQDDLTLLSNGSDSEFLVDIEEVLEDIEEGDDDGGGEEDEDEAESVQVDAAL